MNLSFNLTLNTFQGKFPIRFNSASFCVVHHSKGGHLEKIVPM